MRVEAVCTCVGEQRGAPARRPGRRGANGGGCRAALARRDCRRGAGADLVGWGQRWERKRKHTPFARARQQRAAPVALGWHHAHTRCSGNPHPSNERPRPHVFGGRLAAGNTLLLLLPEVRNQSESSEGAPLGAPPPALLLMCGRRVPARHRVLASQRRRPWSCGDRCARVAALSAPPAPPLTPP